MASSLEVTVTANTSPLQTQFDIANAKTKLLTQAFGALTKASKDLLLSGTVTPELLKASEVMDQARAKSEALRQELQQATGVTKGTGGAFGEFSNLTGLATQALGAFGVALSVGSLVSYGRALFDNAEEIGRQAQVLGLSTDAYQAFTKSAVDAGVSTDTVNTALERFNRAQGEAEIGSKVQAAAFLELGVSANIPAKDAIPALAQALLGLKDKAEQARLETVLFGRSGEEIEPVLQLWAQGIDALTAKLKESGEIIDQDSIAKIRESEEAWNKFTNRLQATYTPKIAEAADQFRGLGNAILDGLDDLKRWNDEWLRFRGASEAQINGFGPGGNWTGSVGHFGNEPTPMPDPRMAAEPGEISNLTAIDAKLEERKDLTLEVTAAQRALADAKLVGDTSGIKQATEALADLKKQLDEINKPESVSRKGVGTAARESAQEEVEAERQASSEINQIRVNDLDTAIALAKKTVDAQRQTLEEEFQAHQITAQQKYEAEVKLTQQMEQLDEQRLRDDEHSDETSLANKIADINKIKELQAQLTVDLANLKRQETEDVIRENEKQLESWRSVDNEIISVEGQLVSDIFSKRQSLAADLMQIGAKLLEDEITNDLRALTEHELVNLGILASDKATAQEGLLFKLAEWALEQTGLIDNQAATTATMAASVAQSKTQAATEIPAYTGIAAMEAASAVAGIPIVGPELAAAAFAQMEALGAIAGGVSSFDVGAWNLPSDMLAMVHQGEMIIPAGPAAAIRDSATGAGFGGGVNVALGVQAIDSRSFLAFMNNPANMRVLANRLATALNQNPSYRPAF